MIRDLRALAALLIVVLLSFAGASAYVYFSVRANIVETIRANLGDEAERNMEALQGRIAAVMTDVDTWAHSPFLRRMLQTRDPVLISDIHGSIRGFAANRNEILGLAVFDTTGTMVTALRKTSPGQRVSEGAARAVLAGRSFQSGVVEHPSWALQTMEFGLPVFDEADPNRVIGGVTAVIDWQVMNAYMANMRVETQRQDKTHLLVLANRDDEVLYHTGILTTPDSEANNWDLLHGARQGAFAVSATSRSVGPFIDPYWTLYQFVDEGVAFAPADRMGRRLILSSGAVLLIAGIATAITIRRVLSHRAASAARRIRALAEAAVEGIVICEADHVVQANASFCDLVGAAHEVLAGRSLLGFVQFGDRPVVRRLLDRPEHATAMITVLPISGPSRPVEIIRRAGTAGDGQTILALRDMSEKLAAQSRIEFLAHHDTLTGLSNRLHFNARFAEELEFARRAGLQVAVLCVDLDRFKTVNDTFGHHGGDALLRATGERVASFLDGTGAAARLGGDEFVAILPVGSREHVEEAAARFVRRLAEPVPFEGRFIETSASIGLAVFPDDGLEADALMRAADLALYRSKQNGRGGVCRYDGELAETMRRRQRLQLDLVRAIEQKSLSLVYQPQALCATGAISGFEVLLRWHHPELGSIPPTTFVAIAEETNLILTMGEWVLHTACAEAAGWGLPLDVAVNISPVQIMSDDLPERIADILSTTGLDARRLELEITESVLIRDIDRAQEVLERIKALGVRVAMDDFGTGYSSLAYLQRIAFDRLKIDRTFIASLEESDQSRTIVRAAVSLARGLGLPVLAEGVETEGQLALLKAERCDCVQGYLIGKPMPIEHWQAIVAPAATAILSGPRRAIGA